MPTFLEGTPDAVDGARIGIVVSRFNAAVTENMLEGAIGALTDSGIDTERSVTVARCPGAFELPFVARRMAERGSYDAVLCLGAVIRGETPHFEYISTEVARGIGQSALDTDTPIIFGVLTTDTAEQARARSDVSDAARSTEQHAPGERGRSGTRTSNKGTEAAMAALEMISLMDQM